MSFPANYDVRVLEELPNLRVRRLFFPGAREDGGQNGVNVLVSPNEGEPWIGTFASGGRGCRFEGVFSSPNPSVLCVVARGLAHLVDVQRPEAHTIFDHITDLRCSVNHQLLLFAELTEVFAYGVAGFVWKTTGLGLDDVHLTSLTDDTLSGTCWDLRSDDDCSFEIDLKTGSHTGGAFEP